MDHYERLLKSLLLASTINDLPVAGWFIKQWKKKINSSFGKIDRKRFQFNSTELWVLFEQTNVGCKLFETMKLLDHFCAQLVFVSMTLSSSSSSCSSSTHFQDFFDYQQNISQILAIYSPLSIRIQEIIERNALIFIVEMVVQSTISSMS